MSLPYILRSRLAGMRAAVDVQHLYKPHRPDDRGATFTLSDGRHVLEAQAASAYAAALVAFLQERGALVITNDPARDLLIGSYPRRNRWANAWRAHAYLACHVNAGGGAYAMVEYTAGGSGAALSSAIAQGLVRDFREILPVCREVALLPKQRGHVCIGAISPPCAAVLLEPFFGDHKVAQQLLDPLRLAAVGRSIGEGVARWWESLN